MKLSPMEIKTLQALRAGPCLTGELYERFGSGQAGPDLIRRGLAEERKGYLVITTLGRQHCPLSRDVGRGVSTDPDKSDAVYVAKKPETISMSKPLDIEALSTPQSGLFKAPLINEKVTIQKGIPMNAVVEKSRSLKVLEYLEAHPKSASATVAEVLEFLNPMAYIKANIRLGEVVFENEGTKRVYSIAPGLKAAEIHRGGEKTTKAEPLENVVAAADDQFNIPAFLRKQADVNFDFSRNITASLAEPDAPIIEPEALTFTFDAAPTDTFEQAQAETRKDIEQLQRRVKFAYTDEHTMLIMRPDLPALELTEAETKRLLDFANEISMVAVV